MPGLTSDVSLGQKSRVTSHCEELLTVAKRIFWFGTPEEALEFPSGFLTYAMTYASDEDIEILRKYFGDDDFKAALDIPHLGFSTQARGRSGISATVALRFLRLRSVGFLVLANKTNSECEGTYSCFFSFAESGALAPCRMWRTFTTWLRLSSA